MDEEGKKELMKEFNDADGAKRLEMWDYACAQQVIWEDIISDMQQITRDQKIDKKLEKMIDEEMKKAEQG